MFDQILVPVDGSRLAENILPHAKAIARAYNSEVTLINVMDPLTSSSTAMPTDPLDWQIRQAEAAAYLAELSARFQMSGMTVRTVQLEGKAPDRVIDYATSIGANLIMLSSHGEGGLSAWNHSSVVTKIIQQARTSVMIIDSSSAPESSELSSGYRRILVPVDGSRRAEYGLNAVARLARDQEAELLIAHVVKPPELPRRTPLSLKDSKFVQQVVESNRTEAARYLEGLKASLDGKVKTFLLVGNSVAEALYTLAGQEKVDLVVLNAHGLGANERRPFGSVAVNFLAYNSIALLIVQDFTRDSMKEVKTELYESDFLGRHPSAQDKARA